MHIRSALVLTIALLFATEAFAVRTLVDRADEKTGQQIRVLYVVPSDSVDEDLDNNGKILNSVSSFQTWFNGQAARKLKIDTFSGLPDIGFVRLTKTDAAMKGTDPNNISIATGHAFVLNRIEIELKAMGQIAPSKLYAVYYGGGSFYACGGGGYPPLIKLQTGAMYLKGTPPGSICSTQPVGASATVPRYQDYGMLHEVMHTMGVVASQAPNQHKTGHVYDTSSGNPHRDLMYTPRTSADAFWGYTEGLILDINRDDYFAHSGSFLDAQDSPFIPPATPVVSMTSPAAGATVSGSSVAVSASAYDDVAVLGVQFKLDGANLGGEDTSEPYSVVWNSTLASTGSHTLTAVARDAVPNVITSASRAVTVAASGIPTVSITAPSAGAVVSGDSVTVSADASDDVAVLGVQFKVDGSNLGAEDTVAPHSILWDTKPFTNASHSLTAVVRDAAPNSRTSAAVPVTINNAPPVPDPIDPGNPPENTKIPQFSIALLSDMANATESIIGTSPVIKLITGAIPSSVEAPDPGVTVATIVLPSDWLTLVATAGDVRTEKIGTWSDLAADATGTPTHFRICETPGSPCYAQSNVTGAGGGGFMEISPANVVAGDVVTVTSFSITEGNQ